MPVRVEPLPLDMDAPSLLFPGSIKRRRRPWAALPLVLLLTVHSLAAAAPRLTGLRSDGELTWEGVSQPAVVTVESAAALPGNWTGVRNLFATDSGGHTTLPVPADDGGRFHRLRVRPVPPTRAGFTNLVRSYGLLETLAGSGLGRADGVSFWQPGHEGGPATAAALSRPHFAMADRAGNVFVVDKNSHSVLRVSTNGTIHTHAGTHEGGLGGDGPAAATSLSLRFPNGLWVRADGTVYILDTDNGRVRRVDTNGVMTTLFLATNDGAALPGGRGLWVADDESLAYFCDNSRVRRWTPEDGLKNVATKFDDLGTVMPDPSGHLLVCDRAAGQAFLVTPDGERTVIAGNGKKSGGGDGELATETSLEGLRSAWPVPTGGHLLLTHESSRLWYLDTAGRVHLLLHGAGGTTHAGDGGWFYAPEEARMSEGRGVSMDHEGNIIVCESDYGRIRRIRFLPMPGSD